VKILVAHGLGNKIVAKSGNNANKKAKSFCSKKKEILFKKKTPNITN